MKIFNSLHDEALVEAIKNGAVGVLPSDTIYGIVASAKDPKAVARLYALKHRDHKPGTVVAASIDQIVDLGIKRRYLKAVEQFWPGAVSVEIPNSVEYLNQNTGRQAYRVPSDEKLHTLLEEVGPLLTSSANQPGEPVADNLAEAQAYFGDTVDFYVDGGDMSDRPPSTLIRIVDDAIEVLRQGAVKIDA